MLLVSYLLGSIPVGYVVGRWVKGIDIRRYGSGNVGATNAFRTMGTGPGLAVLLGDAAKGLLAVLLGKAVGGPPLAILSGLAVMAGHSWSAFLRFQGGRGVATGAGALVAMAPKVVLTAFIIWTLTVLLSRYVSLGSILAAASLPLLMLYFREPWYYVLFGFLAAALVIYRHRPNIRRLLAGTEYKLGERVKRLK